MFERLRALRLEIAREEAMPPYIVFSDRTLIQMCIQLPKNKAEMLKISGVGDVKYEKYGERFLTELMSFIEENHPPTSYSEDLKEDVKEPQNKKPLEKKQGRKVDFYLTEEEAKQFEYDDYLSIYDMRDRLNKKRNQSRAKVVRIMNIRDYLKRLGYIHEETINGEIIRNITETGERMGIRMGKIKDPIGNEYSVYELPRSVQEQIVNIFVGN